MRKNKRAFDRMSLLLLAVALHSAAPGMLCGQSATATVYDEAFGRITDLLESYVDEGRFSGVVAISIDGRVAYAEGFGRVSASDSSIPSPESTLAIGSISKSFTAAVIVQLIAEGRLTEDTQVRSIFPSYPAEFDRVTIRHLLDHTSSIAELVGPAVSNDTDPADLLDAIAVRLNGEPGQAFQYSNTGYLLLGLIIEAVEEKELEDVVAERLFHPLGLESSAMGQWRHPYRSLRGMRMSGLSFVAAPEPEIRFASSGGGVTASAADLARWGDVLNEDRVDDGIEWGAPNTGPLTPSGDPYRNGWFIDLDMNEERYYHSGRITGFDAYLVRLPEQDVAIALLSNLNGSELTAIESGIEAALRGEEPEPPIHRLSRSALQWLEEESPESVAERMRSMIDSPPAGWRAELRDLMDVAGYLAREVDRPQDALPFAVLAEELFDTDPITFVFSGDIRSWAGDSEGARGAYERALEIQPEFGPAVARLRRVGGV